MERRRQGQRGRRGAVMIHYYNKIVTACKGLSMLTAGKNFSDYFKKGVDTPI
jgi:hypothetical protein